MGDGHTSSGTVTGPTGGPFTVTGSHQYAEEGNYTVSVKVADDGGSTTERQRHQHRRRRAADGGHVDVAWRHGGCESG